jgi:hypothetical protein
MLPKVATCVTPGSGSGADDAGKLAGALAGDVDEMLVRGR